MRSAPAPRLEAPPSIQLTRADEHFRTIHEFVAGSKDHPPTMEAAIGKIQGLYQNLNQAANAPNPD